MSLVKRLMVWVAVAAAGVATAQDVAELERIPGPRLIGDQQADTTYRGDYEFHSDWFGNHIPVWSEALASYRGKPDLAYLEIGVFEGRSLVWMLERILTHPTSRVLAIDPFVQKRGKEVERTFRENVKKTGASERVTLIVGFSQMELRKLAPASFDIIYIDGSHRAADVLEDAVLSWRLLRPGGTIVFDDYLWRRESPLEDRPEKAVYEFWWFFRDEIEVVHSGYQVFLRKRAPGTEQ